MHSETGNPSTPPAPPSEKPHVPVIPGPRFFFGISLAAAIFFAVWSALVFLFGDIESLDESIADYWHRWTRDHRGLSGFMIFLTDLGGIATMTIMAVMGALWQSAIKHRFLAAAWLGIVLGGGVVNMAAKDLFNRQRPPVEKREPVVHETNRSYPSGHSMGSAVGYGMLGYALILPQRHRPRRIAAILLMIGIIVAVGFSRIFLRAHWFSDVVAGWTIGTCWLFFCLGWLERHRRKQL